MIYLISKFYINIAIKFKICYNYNIRKDDKMKKSFKNICSVLLTTLMVCNPCHAIISKKTLAKILIPSTAIAGITAIMIYSYYKLSKTESSPKVSNKLPTIDNESSKISNKLPDINNEAPKTQSKLPEVIINEVPENKSPESQKTQNNLPETTKRELDNFNNKEKVWIKFLSGEVLTHEEKTKYNFRYSSCEEFRQDNDNNLECFHDYIQVVFPNIIKSVYGNRDLYIEGKEGFWKALLSDTSLKKNIQETMKKNYNRILNFWNNKNLKSGDHNLLRITRVLISLKLFGLQEEYESLRKYLIERFGNEQSFSNSMKYWNATEKTASLV